ncbi:MAG: Periplasmic dipeptide transport protein (modular protein) [Candidatus Thorarchaeota archaeon]|nr:MAG: Periplasmic dipeptide transport protein (modular protein) [Candidatus Thorarchaeota archaeon]
MRNKFLVILLCSSLFIGGFIPFVSSTSSEQYLGPNVDKIVFNVIQGDDAQILALQENDIDLIGDMIDPSFLPQLEEADDIEVANVLRNGYGYVTINCDKYPFNITAFRRALAFALDKEAISDDVWDGLSQPQDSCVPVVNPFSIEGQLPYNYYEGHIAEGVQLLADAGFVDVDDDGLLEAPNGDDFDVLIEVAQSSNIAVGVGQKVEEALVALNIDATSVPTDFYEYLNRLYFHEDYDIVFMGSSFNDFDVDWLAYEYWSEYADAPYWNFPNFRNASYDSWRDQLLHSVQYEDVYEAAIEMQRIFVYECPIIVCYENILLSAYRTDVFEGYVNDASEEVPGFWTNYKVHRKESVGPKIGGIFRRSNPLDVDTFNFMASSSTYTAKINDMLWDSLFRIGEDGNLVSWLCENYIAATHDDYPEIPENHTRFTFNMIQNASWSDGLPITASDAAFTLNYYRDSSGNPYGIDLTDMVAAYAKNPYTLVVEFNSVSYWHLSTIATKPIVPKHIFNDPNFPAWNEWNPDPTDPAETFFVTSGPFIVSEYIAGEFTELTQNPLYWKNPRKLALDPPSVSGPDNVFIEEGTTGNKLTWTCSDPYPMMYLIIRNDSIIASQIWDGSDVVIDLDSLSIGTYNYTIMLSSFYGQISTHSVMVHVKSNLPPSITLPDDISYEYGTTGNTITWVCGDSTPSSYRIYQNGTVIEEGSWDGTNISKNVDGLFPGTYNFTLELFDESGLSSYDTVFVEVTGTAPLLSMESINMLILMGSLVVIVVFGGAIIRNR